MRNISEVVTVDPAVLEGTPVFAGTRVPVESLMACLRQGYSLDDFLTGFPDVSNAQAEAFLEFALASAMAEITGMPYQRDPFRRGA
jgi:uncharacterized protein (DUF433 family)